MSLFLLNRGARISHHLALAVALSAARERGEDVPDPPPPPTEQGYLLRREGESRQVWRARVRALNKLKG